MNLPNQITTKSTLRNTCFAFILEIQNVTTNPYNTNLLFTKELSSITF